MHGAGSVHQDATRGTWWFVVDVGIDPSTGKRRQVKRRGFATKRAALEELRQVQRDADSGTFAPPSKVTVREYADEWLTLIRPTVQPSTHASYARNLRVHVVPRLGALRIDQVDASALNKLYAELATTGRADGTGGLSARTVRYVATILHRMFGDAVRAQRLQRNPAHTATPPRASAHERPEMVTWNAEQLGQFLARCEGNRYRSLYLVLATTGMRRGEALGLQWGDVDLDERRFSIVRSTTLVDHRIVTAARTKTGRGRRVDLDEPTVAALRAHRAWQAQELLAFGLRVDSTTPVFCLPTGDPYNPERVSREFSRMLDRNPDLPRIRLHDLRHTWATLALGAGVPVKVVSERLGHATSAITMDIYSHVTPTMQQDAASKVAGLIFPGSGIL